MSKKKQIKAEADLKVNVPVILKIIETKADDTKGVIEAYVSIFDNIDLVGDIIRKGAFAESLAYKLPKGVWGHDWNVPVAKTIEGREDDKGLYIKAQFNLDTQRGKEAYSDIKFGIIDEFSIGFKVLDDEWTEDNIRIITKARLYEWSPVLVGANPDTELINIKDNKEEKGETIADIKKRKGIKNIKEVEKVKIDEESGEVKLFYKNDGKECCEVLKMSDSFITYQREQKALKKKVVTDDGESKATRKILRIRQVAKQTLKSSEYVLRITKPY